MVLIPVTAPVHLVTLSPVITIAPATPSTIQLDKVTAHDIWMKTARPEVGSPVGRAKRAERASSSSKFLCHRMQFSD